MAIRRCLPIMAREEVTSIEVKKSTWKTLNQQKEPGDSFDDVIQRLLHAGDEDTQDTPEDFDEAKVCPDCGEVFASVPELLEHVQSTEPGHGT